jgi:flagellar hook-basal body complex protein FliE
MMLPISPIPAIAPFSFEGGAAGSPAAARDLGSALVDSMEALERSHRFADHMSQAAATGQLESVEAQMIAITEAQLVTQLAVAVRNRAVEAFNDVMRMQI